MKRLCRYVAGSEKSVATDVYVGRGWRFDREKARRSPRSSHSTCLDALPRGGAFHLNTGKHRIPGSLEVAHRAVTAARAVSLWSLFVSKGRRSGAFSYSSAR